MCCECCFTLLEGILAYFGVSLYSERDMFWNSVRSEEQNTADVSNSSFYSLLQPFLYTSLLIAPFFALSGVRFSLNVGGLRCRPLNDFSWDSFKWGWHDLGIYLWVCAVSQSWDWRTETQCPRLFTAADHVTSDQPLSLKTASFSSHRPLTKDTVDSE